MKNRWRNVCALGLPALAILTVVALGARTESCVPVEPVDPDLCAPEDCGPQLGMPNWECPDGTVGGPTGACLRNEDGTCGWEIRECDPVEDLRWYQTCGDPVCSGWRDSGLPPCRTETPGEACGPQGATCDLQNMCNSHLLCTDTDPRTLPGGCPISRRAFKQEIRYLTPAERAAYRDEILGVRLATYRYRAAPARKHLGFLIEDQEPSAAVDAERDQIDLYAYTSMAVAALQEQAKEIAALRAELEALKARRTARPAR